MDSRDESAGWRVCDVKNTAHVNQLPMRAIYGEHRERVGKSRFHRAEYEISEVRAGEISTLNYGAASSESGLSAVERENKNVTLAGVKNYQRSLWSRSRYSKML